MENRVAEVYQQCKSRYSQVSIESEHWAGLAVPLWNF